VCVLSIKRKNPREPTFTKDGAVEGDLNAESDLRGHSIEPSLPPSSRAIGYEDIDLESIMGLEASELPSSAIGDSKPELSQDGNEQVEVMRKYIQLKDSENRDLQNQLKHYQIALEKFHVQMNTLSEQSRSLVSELESSRKREEDLRLELQEKKEKYKAEFRTLKSEYEERIRQTSHLESQMTELAHRKEEWQDKVKEDLKRIRLKERELENKYELLKRDSHTLLDSKDRQLLDLKKKNDALELDLENLEDRLRKSNTILASMDQKKQRLVETMRLATQLLENIDALENDSPKKDEP